MSTPINIKIGDETILHDIDSCVISQASGDYCKTVEIEFKSQRFWSECDPLDCSGDLIVRVIIGDTAYQFLCEERKTTITEGGVGFSIWGRSKQAYLSSRYSKTITDTEDTEHPWQTGNTTISEIIDYVVTNYCPYSVTVNWNVPAFQNAIIYKDSLSASNSSPIEIISALAEAVGAILLPQNDGSLSIEPYSVTAGESVAEFSDVDNIISLEEEIEDASGYNAVTVYGYDVSDSAADSDANITTEAVTTSANYPGRDHLMKVYYYSAAGLMPSVQFGNGAYGLMEEGTEEITEDVDLYWGQGNTSMPDVDGVSEVTGDEDVPFAVQSVTYTVNYQKYYLRSSVAGENKAFFYFTDQSAYEVYSYTITSVSEDVCNGLDLRWSSGIVTPPGVSGTYLGVDLYNPAQIDILEKYTSCGANMSRYRQNIQVLKTEQVIFEDGEASLSFPFLRRSSVTGWFSWLHPNVSAQVSVEVGGKTLIASSLIDNHQYRRVPAQVSYYTRYDTYRFLVPDGWYNRLLDVWFYLDGCDDVVAIGGTFRFTVVREGDIMIRGKTQAGAGVLGVSIYVDGIYKGITGSDGNLIVEDVAVGSHTVLYRKDGFADVSETVYVQSTDFIE